MAYDPGALDAALSAAIGDDPLLAMDLKVAFLSSAAQQAIALERAQDATDWRQAAWRLKGLAASFGATDLMRVAAEAGAAVPGDADVIREVREAIAAFGG